MQAKKNWLKRSMAMLFAAVLLAVTSVTVLATTPDPTPTLPDPNEPVSLTVHKYTTQTASNVPGDGTELSPTEAAALGTPAAGVRFNLYRIVETPTGTPPWTVTAGAQADLLADPGTFITDHTSGTPIPPNAPAGTTGVTNDDGIVGWTGLAHGYYVLQEDSTTTPPGTTAVPPSIITLPYGIVAGDRTSYNYNVHVYPKNVSDKDIIKDVDDVANAPAYNIGDEVPWKITGKVLGTMYVADAGQGAPGYGKFQIVDTLDPRLDFVSTTSLVATGGPGGRITLTLGDAAADPVVPADYEYYTLGATIPVQAPDTAEAVATGETWRLTHAGLQKIQAAGATAIEVSFVTEVNESAATGTNGQGNPTIIPNGADLVWRNEGGQSDTTVSIDDKDKPFAQLGGIVIDKVDSLDNTLRLNGAKFRIARTVADAEAGNWILGSNKQPLEVTTSAHPDYVAPTDPPDPSVPPNLNPSAGWGMFVGLDLRNPPVTGVAEDTTFILVETEAPPNNAPNDDRQYVLPQTKYAVTVTINAGVADIQIENMLPDNPIPDVSNPTFHLPKTGGIGKVVFIAMGGLLIVGGGIAGLISRKKRKANNA